MGYGLQGFYELLKIIGKYHKYLFYIYPTTISYCIVKMNCIPQNLENNCIPHAYWIFNFEEVCIVMPCDDLWITIDINYSLFTIDINNIRNKGYFILWYSRYFI